MPDPLMGRYATVKLGTTLVENLGRWNINIALDEIDVSAFGTVWKKNQPGFQGWTGTIEGMYDPADTDGQKTLHDAALAATKIQNIRFYIDSTSYWTPDTTDDAANGCYISSVDITHDKAGVAQVTMNIIGYGKLALV
jgi:hypothetical protein